MEKSLEGCIFGILQEFASVKDKLAAHYIVTTQRIRDAIKFYEGTDGGSVYFTSLEDAAQKILKEGSSDNQLE